METICFGSCSRVMLRYAMVTTVLVAASFEIRFHYESKWISFLQENRKVIPYTMNPSDITLFTTPSTGRGRGTNDASNKTREKILLDGFQGKTAEMFADPVYGEDWRRIAKLFADAVAELGGEGPIAVKAKGGRGFNYDFEVTRGDAKHKVEFKFGGTSVQTIPEFFNPAADKPFHDRLYADFFYDNYLPNIAGLFGLTPPPKNEYLKEIHKNKSTHKFFVDFRAAEAAQPERYAEKSKATAASITAYLETVKDTTMLDALTAEFMRSQKDKRFLLFNAGKFHHDRISDAELTAKSVVGVRNGNLLVIQSEEPGTTHEMLLRWKNHLGVAFPAWQISMRRLAK